MQIFLCCSLPLRFAVPGKRSIFCLALDSEVTHGVIRSVVIPMSDVLTVTLTDLARCLHLSTGCVTLSPTLDLLGLGIVLCLGSLAGRGIFLGGH